MHRRQEIGGQPVDKVRPVYDAFFELFPTAAKYWRSYIAREMQACCVHGHLVTFGVVRRGESNPPPGPEIRDLPKPQKEFLPSAKRWESEVFIFFVVKFFLYFWLIFQVENVRNIDFRSFSHFVPGIFLHHWGAPLSVNPSRGGASRHPLLPSLIPSLTIERAQTPSGMASLGVTQEAVFLGRPGECISPFFRIPAAM